MPLVIDWYNVILLTSDTLIIDHPKIQSVHTYWDVTLTCHVVVLLNTYIIYTMNNIIFITLITCRDQRQTFGGLS